jgi:chorismate mutase/prephenate dehydrogenase
MALEEMAQLREEIAEIDRQIVEAAARRGRLAARIGDIKRSQGQPIRDFSREKDVVSRARRIADEVGLSGDLAEELMLSLIRSSLLVQEQDQVRASSAGTGKTAVVLGGRGHMGRWFVRFLDSQGFSVTVVDPQQDHEGPRSWDQVAATFDVWVVATPLTIAGEILGEMAQNPPTGLIFDIGSLKTPLRESLKRLVDSGAKVTSVHPMFGADTELLSGRHVVLVDVGNRDATAEARTLFAPTMAALVEMDLDAHDRLIAYILGLSHALNIAFFTALAESGESAGRLAELSSTTFDRQLAVAMQVAGENPDLYFEIQKLNQYGSESLVALSAAVDRLRSVVAEGDAQGFSDLMANGAAYLRERMGT